MKFKKYYEKIMASKSKFIIIIGFIGIFLIALSTFSTKKKDEKEKTTLCDKNRSTDMDEYVSKLENKVNSIVSQIDGVGQSKVIITLENGIENVYANSQKKATNTNENFSGKTLKRDDIQTDVVLVDSGTGAGKQGLIITQREPKIRGVMVLCEGGDNVKTVANVVDAVSKCLNIGTNRLSVVKGVVTKNK